MSMPGISAYTSGICGSNQSYFRALQKRFFREKEPVSGLIKDLGTATFNRGAAVARLGKKFKVSNG